MKQKGVRVGEGNVITEAENLRDSNMGRTQAHFAGFQDGRMGPQPTNERGH